MGQSDSVLVSVDRADADWPPSTSTTPRRPQRDGRLAVRRIVIRHRS
jgi:hypothetical protein